jgi:TrmH family RNA methyltransferase
VPAAAEPIAGGDSSLRIVLVATRNPLNIGAVARAMSNFGFSHLRLVKPYDLAFKEARSAVRSHYILEQAAIFETVAEAVADCSLVVGTSAAAHRDLHLPLYRLEPAARLIREHAPGIPALLFGSEKFGLSNEDMSHCNWLLRVPTREAHGSMNLGQAVAVCLYELRRDAATIHQRFPAAAPAGGDDLERVTRLLLELSAGSGWIRARTAASGEVKLRRLVRRLGMPASDTEAWLGMLRQILWKVNRGSGK